ncbi:MAG: aspartate/glutamate racemase family protein [Pseudomonadota bacterium]
MSKRATSSPLGILMLDTQFPRIPGDVGNPKSFDFPVLYETIALASPDLVVRKDPSALLPDFIAAGHKLVARGARGIGTSCGFLTPFQDRLSAALPVPVLTSALSQVPWIASTLSSGQKVGILTISAQSLTPAHLSAAHVTLETPIAAPDESGTFVQSVLGNQTELDVAAAEQEMVQAALKLKAQTPGLAAIVLECTNMPPYAPAIAQATGLPVYSILTSLNWLQAGL